VTAINITTDIPSQINTLEKLFVWAGLALANINPQLTAIEGVGYTERCCQAGIFYIAADNKYRALIRSSVQVSPDHMNAGGKLWIHAMELSSTALPTNFKTN